MKLTNLPVHCTGIITGLRTEDTRKKRLLDLGLIQGTIIKVVRKSPCGEPRAYLFRDTVIAFRSEETDAISVKKLD